MDSTGVHTSADNDPKDARLEPHRVRPDDAPLTTQQGVRIGQSDDSLHAGARGPTLLQDFHTREKITHFDHERIPERVVHARGAGAYGEFQPYSDLLADYTAARFLTDAARRTPVFVRFSTVAGSRGSADTVRDVRGFATKFYTDEGNYDLVGNNFPVFFIQDGVKFPDFVHAVKPEPRNEIPQAQSAHDTLWDFVARQPETLHTIMWLMSDRAIPRSYRMMQGFGVHTFRLVSTEGKGTFVKFHWTPTLGTHSLVWDECQQIAGRDPDFNRRDLWDAIEQGSFPEWELGVQLVPEDREFDFDFDLLDATKIIPEEQVPVQPVGRMVLNRNPDNFFAETEQVAFHTANIVPGIDFTNDPLLQARNFSYLDTQLIRLGGPNFAQLPVNRPVAPVNNNQRDGYAQQRIDTAATSYEKNTLSGGCPIVSGEFPTAYEHYQEAVSGPFIRARSESFTDHWSQAALFWRSMTEVEQAHIVAAYHFELGKVRSHEIRAAVVEQLAKVDLDLTRRVAAGIGVGAPTDGPERQDTSSPALSQLRAEARPEWAATRKVALLAADGVDGIAAQALIRQLDVAGVSVEVLGLQDRGMVSMTGDTLQSDRAVSTMASVLYDAVMVAGGPDCGAAIASDGFAVHFLAEAYKHLKPVGCLSGGESVLEVARISPVADGVLVADGAKAQADLAAALIDLLAAHRVWSRDVAAFPA